MSTRVVSGGQLGRHACGLPPACHAADRDRRREVVLGRSAPHAPHTPTVTSMEKVLSYDRRIVAQETGEQWRPVLGYVGLYEVAEAE